MVQIRWIEGFERYARDAEKIVRDGLLPVLAPGSPRRRDRWESVLAWHLAARTGPVVLAGADGGGPAHDSPGVDAVVALDDEAQVAARVLGAVLARPVLRDAPSARSVLYVGMPSSLTVGRLHRMAREVRRPWGVFTAADAPGLSFVMAKHALARPRPGAGRALIDMRESRTQEATADHRWAAIEPLDDDRVARWLFEREWDTVALDVHGEGAHVNLGRVVGCGLVDGTETDPRGAPVFGCTESSCKRVTRDDQRILHLREVRTRELLLASCNGFAVAADMYPSNLSCVLSAADGYPAQIHTLDRLTAVDRWVPPLLLRLSATHPPGLVREFANDLSARLTGTRPWILFGDPAGSEEPGPDLSPGPLPDTAGEVTVFRHRTRPGSVLGLDGPAASAARLVLGERLAATIIDTTPATAPPGVAAPATWRLTDRSEEFALHSRRMDELTRRVGRIGRLEHAARRLLDARRIVGASDAVRAVREARLRLEYIAQVGLREREDVRRRGVWNPMLVRQSQAAELCVAAWDRALSTLLAEHLFEGVEQVFSDGWPVLDRGTGHPCPRCATRTDAATQRHPLADEPDRIVITCPVCGPSEAYRDGGPRVRVEVPSRFTAGRRARVLVVTSDPREQPLVERGMLRCEMVDKGRGAVFHTACEWLGATTHELVVDLPRALRSDLHTVRAVWVRGLDVTSSRARVAGIGGP